MALLRRSASSLFNPTPPLRPTSVTENLNKRRQSLIVLDSPGIPLDLEASPISWSPRNLIAVVCVKSVFYQNLDTKTVTCLCTARNPGRLGVIEWGHEKHETHIATGMSTGHLHVWDADNRSIFHGTALHSWTPHKDPGVKSLSWNRDVLAVGMEDGEISLVDIRQPNLHTKLVKHHGRVSALEWSANRTHLASGDSNGIVLIWDSRNTREPLTKLRHKGSTRVSLLYMSCRQSHRFHITGSGLVPMEARSPRHRKLCTRRQNPDLEHLLDFATLSRACPYPRAQHVRALSPMVATLQGAAEHPRTLFHASASQSAASPGDQLKRCCRQATCRLSSQADVYSDAVHELDHGARVSVGEMLDDADECACGCDHPELLESVW